MKQVERNRDSVKSATLKRKETFLKCFRNCAGIVKTACVKAGITRKTFHEWYAKDAQFREEVEEVRDEAIDNTESRLFELINGVVLPETKAFVIQGEIVKETWNKHYPPDVSAIIFHLKCLGKKRGYIDKPELDTTETNIEKQVVINVINASSTNPDKPIRSAK